MKDIDKVINEFMDAILNLEKGNRRTRDMLDYNNSFLQIVRLDAGKIATLQQEEANTTLYCDDPNCVACRIHLKNLVEKHREILILIDTALRPYKRQFAVLYKEIDTLHKAGANYVRHVENADQN